MNIVRKAALIALVCLPLLPATFAATVAQDVITIGSASGSGTTTVDIPVSIRDLSGTPLGIDQPPGSRIQSYSIKVNYSPASAVQSISFSRAGITAPLTPLAEFTPSSTGSVSLVDSFEESTNLIPFTSNTAAPGNQVAHLLVHLAPAQTPQTITLTLDPTLTQLANQAGTTAETTSLGTLALVNGQINVAANVPAMSTIVFGLLAVVLLAVGIRRLT